MIEHRKQIRKIENLYRSIKLRKKKRFPKLFIEQTDGGYIVCGYKKPESKIEEIVNVCDSSGMEERMFLNMVFGTVNEFLGGNVDDIHRYFPFAS